MVTKRDYESFDQMMKRFKVDVEKSGVLNELRKREYYIPPSEKRRLKHLEAVKRSKQEEKKRNRFYDND